MRDRPARPTVQQHLCARCRQEHGDPIPLTPREADMLQDFKQEGPSDGVEGLRDVRLEEKGFLHE